LLKLRSERADRSGPGSDVHQRESECEDHEHAAGGIDALGIRRAVAVAIRRLNDY